MQISNRQLALLLPVVERELQEAPDDIEWRDLYERLVKMRDWRERNYGPGETPVPKQVWGRDYV